MVTLAFYKGRDQFFDRAIQTWSRGPYSHVEIIIGNTWYTSSPYDGGVRSKQIIPTEGHWDFITLDHIDPNSVLDWYILHAGKKYDFLGIAGFVIRPIKGLEHRYFCSEAIAEILGLDDPWRYDPNTLAGVVRRLALDQNQVQHQYFNITPLIAA